MTTTAQRILLIEPDQLLGQLYAQRLSRGGYKVRLCSQAQQAVDLIDKQRPDLIILELQLADHSGVEFIYECRSYPEWQTIPIVIHTLVPPNVFSINDLQMKNLGIVQYLYKPSTSLLKLNQVVGTVLRQINVT